MSNEQPLFSTTPGLQRATSRQGIGRRAPGVRATKPASTNTELLSVNKKIEQDKFENPLYLSADQRKTLVNAYVDKGLDPEVGLQRKIDQGYTIEGLENQVRKDATRQQVAKKPNLLSQALTGAALPIANIARRIAGKDSLSFQEGAPTVERTAFDEFGAAPSVLGGALIAGTTVPSDVIAAVVGVFDKGAAEIIRETGDVSDKLEKVGIKTNGRFNAGEFVTDVGISLTAGKKIIQGITSVGKFAAFADKYKNWAKYLTPVAEGLIDTQLGAIASEGRLATGGETLLGGAAGGIIGGAGAAIGAGKSIIKNAAGRLEISGLLSANNIKNITSKLQKIGHGVKSVPERLLDKGIVGTKSQVVQQLKEITDSSMTQVRDAIRSVTKKFKGVKPINSIGKELKRLLGGKEGLVDDLDRVNEIVKNNKSGNLTLMEGQELKETLDKFVNKFRSDGSVLNTIDAANIQSLRSKLRKFLEDETLSGIGVNIGKLNSDVAISRSISDSVFDKDLKDQIKQLVSVFSTSTIGGGLGAARGPSFNENPVLFTANLLAGALIGAGANSTLLKTKIANVLNKLSPATKNEVIDTLAKPSGFKFNDLKETTQEAFKDIIRESTLIQAAGVAIPDINKEQSTLPAEQ